MVSGLLKAGRVLLVRLAAVIAMMGIILVWRCEKEEKQRRIRHKVVLDN